MARHGKRDVVVTQDLGTPIFDPLGSLEACCSFLRCRLERIVENDHRDARPMASVLLLRWVMGSGSNNVNGNGKEVVMW